MIQRAGRAARNSSMQGLFLMIVEPWVFGLQLDDNVLDSSNPDRPIISTIKKNLSKQERTGRAAIQFVQSKTCLREFLAMYLDDQTPSGKFT